MSANTAGKKIVFRHGTFNTPPRVATVVLLCLLTVCFVAVLTVRSWLFLIGFCGFAVSLVSIAYVKFEIGESGFSHRTFFGNHSFEFAHIDDALFETRNVGEGHPALVFSVQVRGEATRKSIPIGIFPLSATALLFSALESSGIQIREDGSRYVQSTMRQVRDMQFDQSASLANGSEVNR
jgi:hypothetical protein